jgi:hypothetical protein
MDVLIDRVAGIDIGEKSLAVTAGVWEDPRRRRQKTRTFGTTTRGLLALRDWLVAERVSVAGMSTAGRLGR